MKYQYTKLMNKKYTNLLMKTFFNTTLWLLIVFPSHAQHILDKDFNMLRNTDILIKQKVLYQDPGRAGENVLWDFSKLIPVDNEYQLN